MPKGYRDYIWEVQEAEKRNKKGRAMGGMIMERKEGIKGEKEEKGKKEDEVITGKICLGGDWWRIVGVYLNKDLDSKLERLREWVEEGEEGGGY